MRFEDLGNGEARIGYGSFAVILREDGFRIEAAEDFRLEARIGRYDDHMPELVSAGERKLILRYMGTEYGIALTAGSFEGPAEVRSENGAVEAAVIRI